MKQRSILYTAIASLFMIGPASADEGAWRLADELVTHMGGTQVWANSSALLIEETAMGKADIAPKRVTFVRDLRAPRIRIDGGEGPGHVLVLSAQGWESRAGKAEFMSAEQNARFVKSWGGNIYVLYRRLASRDRSLQLVKTDNRSFSIAEGGTPIGWIELGADGSLLKWLRYSVSDPARISEEWIYGPSRAYGHVRMPAWGTTIDGAHRFTYEKVTLQTRPLTPEKFEALK